VDVAVGVAVAVVDFELMSVEIKKTLGVLPRYIRHISKNFDRRRDNIWGKIFDILYR
jgi:hypothetical protein